jgi:hypothetical protein
MLTIQQDPPTYYVGPPATGLWVAMRSLSYFIPHNKTNVNYQFQVSVEAGSNTSTLTLRVVGGDEKGTRCLGVYLGHPVPGEYKYATCPSRLGESRN